MFWVDFKAPSPLGILEAIHLKTTKYHYEISVPLIPSDLCF